MGDTFFINKNNKVVVIGNPVHNPNVKELYLEEISRKQPVAPIQTTVKVEKEAAVVTAVNVRVAIKSFSMYNERTWTIE